MLIFIDSTYIHKNTQARTNKHAYIDINIDMQQVVPVGGGNWRLIAVIPWDSASSPV